MAWIKTTWYGDWISWGQNTNTQKWIGRINDNAGNGAVGALRTECSGGYIISTTVLTDGEWHHVASVLESPGSPTVEDIKMYVDGVQEAISNVKPVGIDTVGGRNVWIGDGHHDRPLPSLIDDVRIYDRALSEAEVAAIAYMLPAAPAGYLYDGDVALYTPQGPGSLDGTWDHNNNSDQWDGTGPGEGNPGGAAALVEDGVTFLRIQDTGDPRDYGMPDPSNRKVYLTHLIDGGLDGATLEARIRIATSAPLDNQHPDNRASVEPWLAGGIGYHIRDDGKGMFGISAGHGNGIISFSLAKAGEPDFPDATSDLLVMNNLAGTEPAGSAVDTGDPGAVAANTMDIADATAWNTISISIAAGGAGTHVVTVSVNGGAAQSFDVTAGTGNEANGSYITIGSSGTRGVTAFDLDYISVQ
jgi:hypothetical protein